MLPAFHAIPPRPLRKGHKFTRATYANVYAKNCKLSPECTDRLLSQYIPPTYTRRLALTMSEFLCPVVVCRIILLLLEIA